MPDSGSLRVRRHRLHSRGDHSLCRRCGAVPGVVALPAASGAMDPKAGLENLARRLEAAHEANPADAGVARELRMTFQALGGAGKGDDELSGFLADFGGA